MQVTDTSGPPKTLLPACTHATAGRVLMADRFGTPVWVDPPKAGPELGECYYCRSTREVSSAGCPNCGGHRFVDAGLRVVAPPAPPPYPPSRRVS